MADAMEASMRHPKRLLISIGVGILGAIINLFPVPVFTGVPFYFAGPLSLSVGVLFGPWYGLIASLLAAAPPLNARADSQIILLCAFEALVVSWAVRRHSIRLLAAAFIFRICIFLPWGITVYRFGLADYDAAEWVVIARLILNGVIAAIASELIVSMGIVHRLMFGEPAKPRRIQ